MSNFQNAKEIGKDYVELYLVRRRFLEAICEAGGYKKDLEEELMLKSITIYLKENRMKLAENPKVFLGGTCNNSTWRNRLIPHLQIEYFNPVVEDWTPECQEEEIHQRQNCDLVLYTITPKMTGVYSIAEVVDDSNKRPEKTVLCLIEKDDGVEFDKTQWKSLLSVGKLVEANGGKIYINITMSDLAGKLLE
jgi:hypothetical protein